MAQGAVWGQQTFGAAGAAFGAPPSLLPRAFWQAVGKLALRTVDGAAVAVTATDEKSCALLTESRETFSVRWEDDADI